MKARKFLALALVLAICLGLLLQTASAVFTKRTTDPGMNNTTYNSGNPYSKKQCTWYAWGRYKELCGVDLPSWGNAGNWLEKAKNDGYETGTAPKLGAIACWTPKTWGNDSGHVAVVEEVSTNNTIRISQYNRGIKQGGGEKFGGINDSGKWEANYLERVPGKYFPPAPDGYIYLKDDTTTTTPAKTLTITFDPNGGTVSPTTQTYTYAAYNDKIGSLPTPVRTGYTFLMWGASLSDNTSLFGVYDYVSWVASLGSGNNLTAYARWSANEYTVSFNANGGAATKTSQTVRYDNTYSELPIPTRSGYAFDGWYTISDSGNRVTSDTTVKTASDHTLYAHWTKTSCNGNHLKSEFLYTDTAHPHRSYYRCSICGEQSDDGSESYSEACSTCNPPTPAPVITPTPTPVPTPTSTLTPTPTPTPTPAPIPTPARIPTPAPTVTAAPTGGGLPFPSVNYYYDGTFVDVGFGDWFYFNVSAAYEMGLMKGTGRDAFSPGNNVTIAEAIALAARIHSIYYTGGESFPTYDGGNWYDPYVNYAWDNGIVNTYYNYTRPATREDVVRILAKALPKEALENIAGEVFFADVEEIIYLSEVRLLSSAGVINGIEGYFKPNATITRAEIAAIVARMVQPELRIGR